VGRGWVKRKRQRLRVHIDPVSWKELSVELLKQIIAMVAFNEWPDKNEKGKARMRDESRDRVQERERQGGQGGRKNS
jgi:hypothetical protein